jgi:F-type H+-transporting ATPase subunit a
MDLNVSNLWIIHIGDQPFAITETMRNTWIISGVLILFAIIVRVKLKNFKDVPSGFQNFVETIVDAFGGFVRGLVGEKMAFLANWFFMVFAFILLSNISGLFFLRPPTADWVTNIALAVVTLVLLHVMAMKNRGRAHIKALMQPIFLFLPINLIGELARPVSLSFRLFGNIFSGLILTSLIYTLTPIPVRFGIPIIIHGYFDLFAGILQAYIFCTISLSLIGVLAAPEEA